MGPMTRLFPMLALPAAIVLLQWHGIAFWAAVAGASWGTAFSLTVEWVDLWAWWSEARATAERRWKAAYAWIFLATLTSALVVGAPLYQVGGPLLKAEAKGAEQQAQLDRLEGWRADTQKLAEARPGWQGMLQRNMDAQFDLMQNRLKGLDGFAGVQEMARIVLGAELLGLCLLRVATVVGIRSLAVPRPHLTPGASPAVARATGERGEQGEGVEDAKANQGVRPGERDRGESGVEVLVRGSTRSTNSLWVVPGDDGSEETTETSAGETEGVGTSAIRQGSEKAQESGNGNGKTAGKLDGQVAARTRQVEAVRGALWARFPGETWGETARKHAPPLYVAMSRLQTFERDLAARLGGNRNAKVIGLAELEKLAGLARLGREAAPRL